MRSISVLWVVGVLLLSVTAGVSGEVATTEQRETLSGAVVPLPAEFESDYRDLVRDAAHSYGYQSRDNVALLFADGTTWLVAMEQQPRAGLGTVSGDVIPPERMGSTDLGFIFADDFSVKTKGDRVPFSTLRSSPQQFSGELVRTTAHLSQVTYLAESNDVVGTQTIGMLTTSGNSRSLVSRPGQRARYSVVNLSSDEIGGSRRVDAGFLAASATSLDGNLTVSHDRTDWWINAETTVDILVIPEYAPIGSGSGPTFFPVDTRVQSVETVSPGTLKENGERYEGQVVTIEGDAIGSSISGQETLLAVANCAPESVTVPASPPLCVPVPTDALLHTGAIAVPGQPQTAVPYAGVDNTHQTVPVKSERGHYRITGRVVSTDQIDSRFPEGYGVLIYSRDRIGGLQGVDSSELRSSASEYRDFLKSQLTMSHSEYKQTQKESQTVHSTTETEQTPTPTVQPKETEQQQKQTRQTPTRSPTPVGENRIEITKTSTPAPYTALGDDAEVTVMVENPTSRPASFGLTFHVSEGFTQEKSVRLAPGESRRVEFGYSAERPVRISFTINGKEMGETRFVHPNNPALLPLVPLVPLGGLSFGLGLFFAACSIIASGFVIIKKWRGHTVPSYHIDQIDTVAKLGTALCAIGVWMALGLGVKESAVMVSIVGGAGLFFYGWYWVYQQF